MATKKAGQTQASTSEEEQDEMIGGLPAIRTSAALALPDDLANMMEIMRENLAGEATSASDLDRIPIPSGGGRAWEIPTITGTPHTTPFLEGVVVHQQRIRARYSKSIEESGGNSRPDCFSADATFGVGDPGGDCETCPFNKYPDEEGGGKPCGERRVMYILLPGEAMPSVVSVPPSSLRAARTFLMQLSKLRLPLWKVRIRIGLEKTQNPAGVPFSKLTFAALGALQGEALESMEKYVASIKESLVRHARAEASATPAAEAASE